jgi:hypothetical protein
MLTQFEQTVSSSGQPVDVAKRYCLETLENCANFLRSFNHNANYPASLQNLAIFAPFDFNQLSPNNQLPEALAANRENWYEYRTYHSMDPRRLSGALIKIALRITTDLHRVNQIETTCYPYDLAGRQWSWERPSSDQARIVTVNQHTELVIDYVRPASIPRLKGL